MSLTVDTRGLFERLTKKAKRSIRFKTANFLLSCIREGSMTAALNTPVWSGTTMMNFQWTINTPGNFRIDHPKNWRDYAPQDGTQYGIDLQLEGLQLRSRIFSDPYVVLYLTNTSQYNDDQNFDDLQMGAVTGRPYPIMREVNRNFERILSRVS